MRGLNIITVVGARPQFIKAAAFSRSLGSCLDCDGMPIIREDIIHTGQHYDTAMSKVFFDEMQIPKPLMNLEVGSGSHGHQTGVMLSRIEQVLMEREPDWVLVYGDTNSTLAGALAAAKLHIPVAHVEAGLRSFNRRMPEEINRVVADHISSLLFCPTPAAVENLSREGISEGVHLVGDVMYESLLFHLSQAEVKSQIRQKLNLDHKAYYLATIHRAENTDEPKRLAQIVQALQSLDRLVIWPVHPRTRQKLSNQVMASDNLRLIEPVGYLDMLNLEQSARIILTDSGGVQKEAYWMRVPCITLREETEWVELVAAGCNQIAGSNAAEIISAVKHFESLNGRFPEACPKDLYGRGDAAKRTIAHLVDYHLNRGH